MKLAITQFLKGKTETKYILTLDFPGLRLIITNLLPSMAKFFYMFSVEDDKNSEKVHVALTEIWGGLGQKASGSVPGETESCVQPGYGSKKLDLAKRENVSNVLKGGKNEEK